MSRGLLIVGLDNPQSNDPRYALFPHPSGCAGHRLMKMMMEVDECMNRAEYVALSKTNLFSCGRMPSVEKNEYILMAGNVLRASLKDTDKMVVLLGNEVRFAMFPTNPPRLMRFAKIDGANYAWIPHPSGRNHYYNDTRRRRKVGRFLNEARRR